MRPPVNVNNDKTPNADASSAEENERMKEFREWFAFAQTDYDSAEYLYGAPFHLKPLNVICCHCQQAAEKAIKALIVYFGKPRRRSKSLRSVFSFESNKELRNVSERDRDYARFCNDR